MWFERFLPRQGCSVWPSIIGSVLLSFATPGAIAQAPPPPEQGVSGAVIDGVLTSSVTQLALDGFMLSGFRVASFEDPEFGITEYFHIATLDLSRTTAALLASLGVDPAEFDAMVSALPPGGCVVAVSDDNGALLALLGLDTEVILPSDIRVDTATNPELGLPIDYLQFLIDFINKALEAHPQVPEESGDGEGGGDDSGW